jgi:hypothetical protein
MRANPLQLIKNFQDGEDVCLRVNAVCPGEPFSLDKFLSVVSCAMVHGPHIVCVRILKGVEYLTVKSGAFPRGP